MQIYLNLNKLNLILKLVISIEKLHKTQLEFKQLYVHSIYTQNLNTQTFETK